MNLESLLELAGKVPCAEITLDRGYNGYYDEYGAYFAWTLTIRGRPIRLANVTGKSPEEEYNCRAQAIREELITVLREMLVLLEGDDSEVRERVK